MLYVYICSCCQCVPSSVCIVASKKPNEEEDPYGGSTDEESDMDTEDVSGMVVCILATFAMSLHTMYMYG